MKYLLIALLAATSSITASAQKHNLFPDLGLSLAYGDPGFSLTYNYNIARFIGVGAGVQGYVYHPAITNPRHFTPAAYFDLRFHVRPKKISQYYAIMDVGMNFYQHSNSSFFEGKYAYSVPKDNGVYVGLALGYFLRLTHRGWGPYTTVKLINNLYRRDQLNVLTNETKSTTIGAGTLVLSLGFRFGDNDDKVPQQ